MYAKISIPAAVAEQLEEIRLDGICNMLDRVCVRGVADDLEFLELSAWVEDHKREYGRMILEGFEVEPPTGGR